ncbi:scavenger receptor class F member 2 [Scyliorhinus torazame]
MLSRTVCTMDPSLGCCFWAALVAVAALSRGQELSPSGRNVCRTQGSPGVGCCPGWKQQGNECPGALCQGNFSCKANEICVRPNECRCRHGYFGANCETKCPERFWGPDCKEMCLCHPNGRCADATGKCTCNPNRWGPTCNRLCPCQYGKCDQDTGKCKCEPRRWGTTCSNICYCSSNSQCDPKTGKCICQAGWWGRSCHNQCSCNSSPCDQLVGRCQCKEKYWGHRCERCLCFHGKCNPADGSCSCYSGYRGRYCRETCPAGYFGLGCKKRCGQCKNLQPCMIADGRCLACEPGWNGTRCDKICSAGFYGEGCGEQCPRCKDGHACNHINGKCLHCNPGWIGARCDVKCQNGTYGENCNLVCTDCINGFCHFATGECVCNKGFHGPFCNMTCPSGHYGANCAHPCPCIEADCDPVHGTCILGSNGRVGVIAAGALVLFLLLLLLLFLCCYCLCHKKNLQNDSTQAITVRGKQARRRLRGTFSQISTKLPRIPIKRQKFPKVVVAHHDMENTLNCSFIEPPSMMDQPSPSWSSHGSFSSFDTADDGPVYCVPHEESVLENSVRERANLVERLAPPINEEDAGEYTCLKGDPNDTLLLKLSDSEASSNGSGSTSGAVYAKVARLSKQSKGSDVSVNTNSSKNTNTSGKHLSSERTKPPPPDPSTKPKLSWIHGKFNTSQSSASAATRSPSLDKAANQVESHHATASSRRRNLSESSAGIYGRPDEKRSSTEVKLRRKDKGLNQAREQTSNDMSCGSKMQKTKAGPEQMQNLNGAVQNALKRIATLPDDRKLAEGKESPRGPPHAKGRSEVIHPQLPSETATMLAQLKEKTQIKSEVNMRQNGLISPQQQREKPTPPQKAKRSFGANNQKLNKAVIPTSTNLQKMINPSPEHQEMMAGNDRSSTLEDSRLSYSYHEQDGMNCSQAKQETGDQTPKRTPIKKPPRKRSKEATLDSHPKTAVLPPQVMAFKES